MRASERTQVLADHLRSAIRSQPLSQREIERRLGMGKGYLSQLLGGHVDLKVEHLFSILEVIGMEPGAFFGFWVQPQSLRGERVPSGRHASELVAAVDEAFESLDLPAVAKLEIVTAIVDRRIEHYLRELRSEFVEALASREKTGGR